MELQLAVHIILGSNKVIYINSFIMLYDLWNYISSGTHQGTEDMISRSPIFFSILNDPEVEYFMHSLRCQFFCPVFQRYYSCHMYFKTGLKKVFFTLLYQIHSENAVLEEDLVTKPGWMLIWCYTPTDPSLYTLQLIFSPRWVTSLQTQEKPYIMWLLSFHPSLSLSPLILLGLAQDRLCCQALDFSNSAEISLCLYV